MAVSGKKIAFALLVALFVVVNVGGVFTAEMMGGTTDNCPYMGAPALCAMSPLEHLSQWQETFAAVAQKSASEAFLLLALLFLSLFAFRLRLFRPLAVVCRSYSSLPSVSRSGKKTHRWLSLFEQSPSAR